MQRITANAGRARKTTLQGRQFLVAPITMIVPGVLNGSKGPLYYSAEEISRNYSDWNGTPIVVYHPSSSGSFISARDPDVWEKQGVGNVYRVKVSSDGRLRGEGWFDVEALRKVDERVLTALEEGTPVEVSTGLHTENIPAEVGATHNGVAYTYLATNYRPDHLAVLPDEVGACSIKDGCGLLANSYLVSSSVTFDDQWQPILVTNASGYSEGTATFEEGLHPRGYAGKFSPGGSAGGGAGVVPGLGLKKKRPKRRNKKRYKKKKKVSTAGLPASAILATRYAGILGGGGVFGGGLAGPIAAATSFNYLPVINTDSSLPIPISVTEFVNNPKGQWQAPSAGKDAPRGVKAILQKVYSSYRDKHPAEDSKVKARGAKIAWAAVKKAGYYKDQTGKWRKRPVSNVVGQKTCACSTASSSVSAQTNNWEPVVNMANPTLNADVSFDDIREELCELLREQYPTFDSKGMMLPSPWIRDVFDGYFIYCYGDELYRQDYEVDSSGEVTLSESEPVEVDKVVEYVPVGEANSGSGSISSNHNRQIPQTQRAGLDSKVQMPRQRTQANGRPAMKLTQEQREQIITDLTGNCECWQNEGDDEVLNGFSDQKLLSLRKYAAQSSQALNIANSAVSGFQDGSGNAFRLNPETGKWEQRVVNAAVDENGVPITSGMKMKKKKGPPEGARTGERQMSMDAIVGQDGESYTDGGMTSDTTRKKKRSSMNSRRRDDDGSNDRRPSRPRTFDELLRLASPEVQNKLSQLQALEQREKDQVISKILANVADTEKQANYEHFQKYSLEELNRLLPLIPQTNLTADAVKAAPAVNRKRRESVEQDMLVPATLDWTPIGSAQSSVHATNGTANGSQHSGNGNGTAATHSAITNGQPDDSVEMTDEDWLRNAPGHIRTRVYNALSIENREKQKLIDELTANVADEEVERRLVERLKNRSLEELRDMLALQPPKGTPRPSFLGAATANTGQFANNVSEDLLPPTKLSFSD